MNNIRCVLFDLGNVLAYIDFDAFWKSLGYLEQQHTQLFKSGYASWTMRYEHGYVSTEEYFKGLHTVFGGRFSAEELTEAFGSILLEPVEGMTEIVTRIARTHDTGLVSNTSEIHYALSLRKFPALKILSRHYLSFRLHTMKPAKEFYRAILNDQPAHPSEILFIDDLAENIGGAQAAGMQAVKFDNLTQIKTRLHDFGVLP